MAIKVRLRDRCAYKNCGTTIFDLEGGHFFRFPADHKRRQLWITNSGNEKLATVQPATAKSYGLCTKHFTTNQFLNSSRLKLKGNALPIAFEKGKVGIELSSKIQHPPRHATSHIELDECGNDVSNSSQICSSTVKCMKLDNAISHDEVQQVPSTSLQTRPLTSTSMELDGDNNISTFLISVSSPGCLPSSNVLKCKKITNNNPVLPNSPAINKSSIQEPNKDEKSIFQLKEEIEHLQRELDRVQASRATLIKQIDILTTNNENYANKIQKLQYAIRVANNRESIKTVDDFIDVHEPNMSSISRTMIRLQFRESNTQYSQDEKDLAKLMFHYCRSGYSKLRKAGLVLPVESSVQ